MGRRGRPSVPSLQVGGAARCVDKQGESTGALKYVYKTLENNFGPEVTCCYLTGVLGQWPMNEKPKTPESWAFFSFGNRGGTRTPNLPHKHLTGVLVLWPLCPLSYPAGQ